MTTYDPVHIVFRGWREQKGKKKITVTEHDGGFPSVNDIGISGRQGKHINHPFNESKKFLGICISALLREPPGSEYRFIKPGTVGVECILDIERSGELPQGCGFVLIEGKCFWPSLQQRDQNNYAAIVFKFVPDVLEQDGYLAAHDDWLGVQCGNLERGLNSAVPAYTELTFFPSPDRLVLVDEGIDTGEALF